MREIAEACGMRPGNLTYHFPQKKDIVTSLFLELQNASTEILHAPRGAGISQMFAMTRANFVLMLEYRFFFVDLILILEETPGLMQRYQKLSALRRNHVLKTLRRLQKGGAMLPMRPADRDAIFRTMSAYTNFWISDALLEDRAFRRAAREGRTLGDSMADRYARSLVLALSPWFKPPPAH